MLPHVADRPLTLVRCPEGRTQAVLLPEAHQARHAASDRQRRRSTRTTARTSSTCRSTTCRAWSRSRSSARSRSTRGAPTPTSSSGPTCWCSISIPIATSAGTRSSHGAFALRRAPATSWGSRASSRPPAARACTSSRRSSAASTGTTSRRSPRRSPSEMDRRARPTHTYEHAQGAAQGQDLRRLPAQRARRDVHRAVLAARAPGRAGRHADQRGTSSAPGVDPAAFTIATVPRAPRGDSPRIRGPRLATLKQSITAAARRKVGAEEETDEAPGHAAGRRPCWPCWATGCPTASYLYEPKWDGFRAIVFRDGDESSIQSRHQRLAQPRYFPELVEGVKKQLPRRAIVVDGEIVIAGDHGLDFDALLLRLHPSTRGSTSWRARRPAELIVASTCSPSAARRARAADAADAARCSRRSLGRAGRRCT